MVLGRLVACFTRNQRPLHDFEHLLEQYFVFSLTLISLQDFLSAGSRLLEFAEICVHVTVALRVMILNCRAHRHNALNEVEILSRSLVLVSEVFGVVNKLCSTR